MSAYKTAHINSRRFNLSD